MSLQGTKQSPCLQAGDCFATLAMTIPRHLLFYHYGTGRENKFLRLYALRPNRPPVAPHPLQIDPAQIGVMKICAANIRLEKCAVS